MKYFLLTLLLLCSCGAYTQNLVPNPSFEEYSNCPSAPGQTYELENWIYASETPDYFNSCDRTNTVSVPKNILGFQSAYSGNGYVGLYSRAASNISFSGYTEIIGASLTDSLVIGKRYFASMNVSLANNSNCATNNIGVLFSTVPLQYNYPLQLPNHAQLYAKDILTDTLSWITISGSFASDSNYKYIFIGNFFDNVHTDSIMYKKINVCNSYFCEDSNTCYAYYYIDNVCVSSDSMECNAIDFVRNYPNDEEINIYPNPADKKILIDGGNHLVEEYLIINLLGETIKTIKTNGTISIDVSDLPDGMYLLEFNYNNNSFFKKQIIIH